MRLRALLFSLTIALLTAACHSQSTQQNAAEVTSVSTNLPVFTETPRATNTIRPTATPSTTPKPATSTSTPDFYATAFWATSTAIVKAVVATTQPRVYASYLSPNGEWRAAIIIYDCTQVTGLDTNSYEQLKLTEVETGIEKEIDNRLLYCGGVGAGGLAGLFWSPHGRYFYYTDARDGVPDGLCWYWERPIYRLDVVMQKTEFVGGGPLSPDKTKIALWQVDDLVIWGLDEGELARVPAAIPGAMKGPISWSPDTKALAYLQTTSDCFPFGKSYLIRVDIPNLEQSLLLESETPSFIYLAWDAPNRIKLSDTQSKQWRYNLVTKELKSMP